MASLDILMALGLEDRVVGSASSSLEYVQSVVTAEGVANLGTIKTADMEAVMACEPDIIFIGGRLSGSYDTLSEIAPVVYLPTTDEGTLAQTRLNAATIASIFGKEAEVAALFEGFDARIETLKSFADGKTAIVGLVTSGGFNVLGNDGRCSIIGREVGFTNVGVDAEIDTATHGNEASFEFIVEKAPEYIFVMDRDAAIQNRRREARAGNHGKRAGYDHGCLQKRQHRLSGPSCRVVHCRGWHYGAGYHAAGSGSGTAAVKARRYK